MALDLYAEAGAFLIRVSRVGKLAVPRCYSETAQTASTESEVPH